MAIERGEVYAAKLNDKTIATLRLQWTDDLWGTRPDDAGYVHTLAVERACAGNSIGLALLDWAAEQVRVAGRKFLRLDCMAENPALRDYYTRAGFTLQGEASKHGWKAALFERPVNLRFDLRPATDADYDFLWRLAKETMQGYVHAIWGWDEDWQAQRFRGSFDASQWRVITVDGQNAGGLLAGLRPSDGGLFLSNIYLLPGFQNRGIGSAIVQSLLAEARTSGLPLTLNVLKSNPDARRLYERLGLRVVRENAERFFMEG